jgi:hypothetical protein
MKPGPATLLSLVLLLSSAAAGASPTPRNASECWDRQLSPWYDFDCILTQTHSDSTEAAMRGRDQMIRLVDWDAWGRLLLLADFTRDAKGALMLRLPAINDGEESVSQRISLQTWRTALAALARNRHQSIYPPTPKPLPAGQESVCVMADGIGERVELALDNRVERIHSGDSAKPLACFNAMDGFGEALRGLVVSAIPACSALKLASDDPILNIEACRTLSGDRMAAAALHNAAEIFTSEHCDRPKPAEDFLPSVAPDAVLTIANRPGVTGAREAMTDWLAFACERREFYRTRMAAVHGKDGTISGWIIRSRPDPAFPNHYLSSQTTYTQHWTRGADGVFRMQSFTIQDWSPEKGDPHEPRN